MNTQSRSPFGISIHTKSIIFSPLRGRIAQTLVCAAIPAIGLLFPVNAVAQLAEPKVKVLAKAADPLKNEVLVGRVATGGMEFQLSLEGSEAMWMPMGNPPVWGAHKPSETELYHVELKLTDPKSKTRIPYANIIFTASNKETGKTLTLPLPPMWGSSGLHYSENSALLGNGTYAALVTVEMPTFHRELKDKDLWNKPVQAKFHFKLQDRKLTEVSEASR